MRLDSWHKPEFDICTESIDPNLSIYSDMDGYADKILNLCKTLGVGSVIWASDIEPVEFVNFGVEAQYIFDVSTSRIAAYVDTAAWDNYINNRTNFYIYSTFPVSFAKTSYVIEAPIGSDELVELRVYLRYHIDRFELIRWIPLKQHFQSMQPAQPARVAQDADARE